MFERLRGLKRHEEAFAGTLLLRPCHSVHTFGMCRPLDVAFVDREGTVVDSVRAVQPGRVLQCRQAFQTLERYASPAPWPEAGQRPLLLLCSADSVDSKERATDGETQLKGENHGV